MKKPIPLLLLLLAAWITGMSYFSRQTCGDCGSPAAAAVTTTAVTGAKGLLIADNGQNFSASTDDNLTFNASAYNFTQPLSAKLQSTFKSVAAYLVGHPDRSITVNGLYAEAEKNTSIYPNLGLARAQSIKKYLESLGVPEKQIGTSASMSALTDATSMVGGATYSFNGATAPTEDLGAKLADKKIILYFETNSNTLALNAEQRAFFADAITYLDKNPSAKINVTGHTDSKGNVDMNTRLSQERANFVKKYLSENNIKEAQIVPTGKGPTQPIADNGTPEGMAKNRRVEITLSK
jgi:outer membrane protein OmpA-like peptidoglycan-associated protein